MRAALVVLVGLFVIAPTAADAEAPARKKPKTVDERVDVSAVRPRLIVLTDGKGAYLVADPTWSDEHWLFYGDGKTFRRQRVGSAGADGSQGTWSMRFWSPRVDGQADVLGKVGGAYALSCGKTDIPLTKLPDAEAARILDGAAFHKPLWRRQAVFLARDSRGTYYYIDRLRDELGGKDHRIFVGLKGAMKQLPMTNIVSDSVGDIYSTRKGELRFVTSDRSATWIERKKKVELTVVPVEDNIVMIYGDLGVYEGSLGTPCDEF